MVVHDLGVDADSARSLQACFDAYAKARRERLREIQRLREQTSVELSKPPIDMAKVDALVDQVARLRAELQKETLRTLTQLEPACAPTSANACAC